MPPHLYAELPTRMGSLPAVLPNWLKAFVLLGAAHTVPWATGYLLGRRLGAPIDAGIVFMLADLAAIPLRRHPPRDDVSDA